MWLGSSEAEAGAARAAAAVRLRQLGLRWTPPRDRKRRASGSGLLFGGPLSGAPAVPVGCCGGALEVPAVVCDACDSLRGRCRVEGIFRKAGSQNRQKEMRRRLESGGKFDEGHNPVDVAALLKLYLRLLPEPAVGEDVQELLLRCWPLPEERRRRALPLGLLFLPRAHLHLLHYVMEFLKDVAAESDHNKMDSNNLAIIMAPTLMPPPLVCPPHRMERHVELVKYLIDNANIIGIIPSDLPIVKPINPDKEKEKEKEKEKKKKKRRSGSLTRMFTGLKKMVSSTTNKTASIENLATPVIDKSAKKRADPDIRTFSAKKRKEIMDAIPLNTLASTPRISNSKEFKRLRLSIGHKSKEKYFEESVILRKHSRRSCDFIDGKKADGKIDSENKSNEYVRIPKSEYEEIKNRVSAIENQISQEFNAISAIDRAAVDESVKHVQTAYEKTLEEAAALSSPGTEHLAKRLSRELKIRQPNEPKIIRSPSARKIGTMRRRSRENVTRLTRTQTWSSSSPITLQSANTVNKSSHLYSSNGLKRGRPNTVTTGLTLPNFANASICKAEPKSHLEQSQIKTNSVVADLSYAMRNCAKRPSSFHGVGDISKSIKDSKENVRDYIPPSNVIWNDARSFLSSSDNLENPLTGRASVAQLRNRMAGMVMAKAKLFDALTDSDSSLEKPVNKKSYKSNDGFARKARKPTSPVKLESDTEAKVLKRPICRSPGYISKKHRTRLARSPILAAQHLNLSAQLKDVIYDVCTPLSEKLAAPSGDAFKSPARGVPQLKKSLKPVGGFRAGHQDLKRVNTPVRANPVTPRRQSPRLLSMKARQIS